MSLALLFPGQGSQFVGMGRELAEEYPAARAVFAQANEALGFALSSLMFEGPEATLTDTLNAQPALLAHSTAIWRVLVEAHPGLNPAVMAGHSMGEYSALVAAEALDFPSALHLVRARGQAMKNAGERAPGAMAAILGLDAPTLRAICEEAGRVQVANDNAPGQIVISGDKAGLERALALAKSRGAKRVIPLAVSIAAHSELMRPAADEFRSSVERAPFRTPRVPVISNVTARPLQDVEEIRRELVAQLTSPVRWVESVQYMGAQGVTEFLEVGPKDVLTGLNKRILPNATAIPLGTQANLKGYGRTVGSPAG